MPRRVRSRARAIALKKGFRSGLEHQVSNALRELGADYDYEPKDRQLPYQPKPRHYLPDFVLPNGVILEAKGRLTQADRVKHLLLKEQHPDIDIRFVFKVDNKLSASSKTRYSEWCDKHGFLYCFVDEGIPKEWLK